jgi:hypothetical protein
MTLTDAQIAAAREWVKDCVWGDVEDEGDVDAMDAAMIVRGVARHYDGGLLAFVADCGV